MSDVVAGESPTRKLQFLIAGDHMASPLCQLMGIQILRNDEPVTEQNFTFGNRLDKLRKASRHDGFSLRRSNMTGGSAAKP